MTQLQEKTIEEIEALIIRLSLSDKKDIAKGEIESLKTALRHVEKAFLK